MTRDVRVAVIDGYIDDPAALGVPPYISPVSRAVAGAAIDAGAEVEYLTVDGIRRGAAVPEADASIVISGNTVPGRYLRSMPMSQRELAALAPRLRGWKLVAGSAASSPAAGMFDFALKADPAASLFDGLRGREVGERLRTLGEWNRWMVLGAAIAEEHPDFPQPLIAEVESYRGCHRYASGGCSYCIEPLKGKPLTRAPGDILEEAEALRAHGVRNVRVGGQTCIVSYGSDDPSGCPRPRPDRVSELFGGLAEMRFDVLHVDNADPAVIAEHPDESRAVLEALAELCTPGNVLALGMESADPRVIRENNLNSTPAQVLEAVEAVNRAGSARGWNGMPKLLPGLNLIAGLDGETAETYRLDAEFLRSLAARGLLVRRINIRQVLPVRRSFATRVDPSRFRRFKQEVREGVDRAMLERILPAGTVLRRVYTEIFDGGTTFGRQIGTYPLLIGIPYRTELGRFVDVAVTGWGYRSATGVEHPFPVNSAPMSALTALPGVGRRRAAALVRTRPFGCIEDVAEALGDPAAAEALSGLLSFER